MGTFYALLVICAGNSPVTGELLAQRPVTRSFDDFFDLGLNERLSKQSWGWWFETPSHSLWRHSNDDMGRDRCERTNQPITQNEQAVPINGDNIPPLWSVPTPSRNTQQIVLFLSHCGSYTGENHSRVSWYGRYRGCSWYKKFGKRKKSFREKLRKHRFSVNFWPPEGQKWGHEHENR